MGVLCELHRMTVWVCAHSHSSRFASLMATYDVALMRVTDYGYRCQRSIINRNQPPTCQYTALITKILIAHPMAVGTAMPSNPHSAHKRVTGTPIAPKKKDGMLISPYTTISIKSPKKSHPTKQTPNSAGMGAIKRKSVGCRVNKNASILYARHRVIKLFRCTNAASSASRPSNSANSLLAWRAMRWVSELL